jgi:serine/threonine protein kinase
MPGFIEHYRILDRIGRDNKAETYVGLDEQQQRKVVLKFIDPVRFAHDAARARFLRDLATAAALAHPALCTIYEVLEIDRQPLIVLEHVEGRSVLEATAKGPLPPRDVGRLGRELADGLSAAHRAGLLHRDISATNVMLADHGGVKLMDLGLAQVSESELAGPAPVNPGDVPSRAMMIGTPVYLAPELLTGGTPTISSDLYAIGVVLYRMATGQLPFAERMTPGSLVEMLLQAPVPPSLLVAGLPPSLERAIMSLLEKRPEARFPSAESLAATLALAERT